MVRLNLTRKKRPTSNPSCRLVHAILRPEQTIRPQAGAQHHKWPARRHARAGIQGQVYRQVVRALRQARSPRLHEPVLGEPVRPQLGVLGARVLQARHLLLYLSEGVLRKLSPLPVVHDQTGRPNSLFTRVPRPLSTTTSSTSSRQSSAGSAACPRSTG